MREKTNKNSGVTLTVCEELKKAIKDICNQEQISPTRYTKNLVLKFCNKLLEKGK